METPIEHYRLLGREFLKGDKETGFSYSTFSDEINEIEPSVITVGRDRWSRRGREVVCPDS